MKATLATQLGQQLHLTPALLQSIRLLQLNGLQLEQEIRQVLENNPLLEIEEEASASAAETAGAGDPQLETAAFDELPESSMWDVPGASWNDADEDRTARLAMGESSDPHLRILQALSLDLDEGDLAIAGFWLEHCDDAGYLQAPLAQLTLLASARFDRDGAHVERIRQRLLAAAHTLHAVDGMPHAAIAARIREAGIDVLFDLRGWGGGGTPEVLAMRPAPLQVNWLAYPGTSGAPWIDYVLADAFVLPPALEPAFSEKVLRLPRAFQPSDNTRVVEAPPPRGDCGLPGRDGNGGGVVFCCFNNSYKLNPRSVARLLEVLRGVPGSVLWLLSGPGLADQRLREVAQRQGIDPSRLVFMPKLPHPHYLARYRHADLFLDTHPYNAHTTASDALWAGCPVLTTPGHTFAARVAGSLNHHLGLDEMNAADDAAFVATAIRLGNDPAALAGLRQRLAAARRDAGLFDMAGFARDFAALLKDLRQRP